MSHVDHVEVAPRMWDKRIAANYIKHDNVEEAVDTTAEVSNHVAPMIAVAGKSLMQRLKAYLLPAAFVIGLLLVVYVLYTYVTKYRKAKNTSSTIELIEQSDIKPSKTQMVRALVQNEDLSKYEYDSDASLDEPQLSTIEELEEGESDESESGGDSENDSSSNEEFEDDDEEDYDTEPEEEESDEEPDLSEIEQLIMENSTTDSAGVLEDEYSFDIPSYIEDEEEKSEEEKPKPKRSARKPKRVTL